MDNVENNGLDPAMIEKARAAFEAMTKAMLDAGRRYEERMNAATTAALSAANVPGLVAEVERLRREVAAGIETERGSNATARRLLAEAREQVADLRAGIEALAAEFEKPSPSTLAYRAEVARALRALLAGSVDQPGEACCDALSKRGYGCTLDPGHPGEHVADDDDGKVLDRWDRPAPVAPAPSIPTLAGRASTGANPAPVVPDSEGLRVDDDWLHIYWRDPVEGCWVAYRRADCVGEEELPSGRLLAVVGQGVTAEEDRDGLLPIEREVADFLWQKWRDPDNPAVLIHEDPRTVARHLRPYLRAAVRPTGQEQWSG